MQRSTVIRSTDKGPETVAVAVTISLPLATGVSKRATVVSTKANWVCGRVS